jgi:hypothetical protein
MIAAGDAGRNPVIACFIRQTTDATLLRIRIDVAKIYDTVYPMASGDMEM